MALYSKLASQGVRVRPYSCMYSMYNVMYIKFIYYNDVHYDIVMSLYGPDSIGVLKRT